MSVDSATNRDSTQSRPHGWPSSTAATASQPCRHALEIGSHRGAAVRDLLPDPVHRPNQRRVSDRTDSRVVAFAGVLAWQLHQVRRDDLPGLRAIQALGVTILFFLLVFAALYLSISQASTAHFSEALDHTGALYLSITLFSTVGFGDITPESDLTRIVVSIEMLLDLVVIGAVVRLLDHAAKSGVDT